MSGVSGSQETSGPSVETSDISVTGERREVGSSSSVNVDTIGISSSEIAASSGVATSSQEEILECDLDVDDDGEMSEDLEEAEAGDMNPDNLEGTTDEDENNSQQEPEEADANSEGEIDIEIDQHQPEVGAVEDNSSEPSSSTGTRRSAVAGPQVFSLDHTLAGSVSKDVWKTPPYNLKHFHCTVKGSILSIFKFIFDALRAPG